MEPTSTHNREVIRRSRFLGRYELIGALGRGGMGSVYLARHAGVAGFHRLFAMKILHEHLAAKPSFVDMLRDEARIAARLHHPNVVPVVDLGTHGEDHYIVLDYVEGPSFSKLWKRSGGEAPRELLISILLDTLEGLHAAHILKDDNGEDLHLIHRDVSPSNILVGIDGIARITDFGIAKAESRLTSTKPGVLKGSLQYMSPEQVKNRKSIDRRTDVWSVGVILWNALTGERLFEADSDGATIEAILNREVQPPSMKDAKPPACFDEVVLRALEREPKKRYSSALEMGDALRRMAAEHGMIGSRQQVAEWVEGLFGDELEERRSEIRKVVRRRSTTPVTNDISRVTLLPSLSSPPSLTSGDDMTISSHSSESDAGTGETTVPAFWTYFWTARFQKRHFWVYLAVMAVFLIGVAVYLYQRPTQSSITVTELKPVKTREKKLGSQPGVAQRHSSPATVATGQPSEPQSKSRQPKERVPEKKLSPENNSQRTYRPAQGPIQGAKRPANAAMVAPKDTSTFREPKPQPISEPDPKAPSAPPSTPSSEYEFEKNPYVMH